MKELEKVAAELLGAHGIYALPFLPKSGPAGQSALARTAASCILVGTRAPATMKYHGEAADNVVCASITDQQKFTLLTQQERQ